MDAAAYDRTQAGASVREKTRKTERARSDIIFINFKLYADEVFIARGHKIFPVIYQTEVRNSPAGQQKRSRLLHALSLAAD